MTGARASCEETQSRARDVKASRQQEFLALPFPSGRDGEPRAGGPQLSAVQPPPPTLGHDPLLIPVGKGSLKGQEVLQVTNSLLLSSGPGPCPKAGAGKPHPLPSPPFSTLKPNPFYSSLTTTSVLGILILTLSPWEQRSPGCRGLRGSTQGPKGGHGPGLSQMQRWQKMGPTRCHVTLQLCAPGRLELSSTGRRRERCLRMGTNL